AADTVVAVADGARWCQQFYAYHLPAAIRILDFPHAAEHLSQAAGACFGPGPQAEAWVVMRQVEHYLRERLPQLAYADFVAAGYPIGSGAVESANKRVVEAR